MRTRRRGEPRRPGARVRSIGTRSARATLLALLIIASARPALAQDESSGTLPTAPGAAEAGASPRTGGPVTGGTPAGDAQARGRALEQSFGLSVRETYTDNVNLTPEGRSDFITEIRPSYGVRYLGRRAELHANVSVPILLYARTGAENNSVIPLVNARGKLEAIERFFYIEGTADVSRQYLSPFGPRPVDIATASQSQYTSQRYAVTPYIKGEWPNNVTYEVRDSNQWTTVSDASVAGRTDYLNHLTGYIQRAPLPFGARAEIQREDVNFGDRNRSFVTSVGRVLALYAFDRTFVGILSVGYERADYPLFSTSGGIYGAGFQWRSERSNADVYWEDRFFGSSYRVNLRHRGPMWSFTADAVRVLSSYPQQLAVLPEGASAATLLDAILTSRIPDPIERQTAVDEIMRQQSLPTTVDAPTPIYTQQIYVDERASVGAGVTGVRNSVFVTLYRQKSRSLQDIGVSTPLPLDAFIDNTQTGVRGDWSYKLAPKLALTTTAGASRTQSNGQTNAESRQWYVRLLMSKPISPDTDVFAGARYVDFNSDIGSGDYRERAVFAGFSHRFR